MFNMSSLKWCIFKCNLNFPECMHGIYLNFWFSVLPFKDCSHTAFGSMPSHASGITMMASRPYLVVVVVGWLPADADGCWPFLVIGLFYGFRQGGTAMRSNWLFPSLSSVCVCGHSITNCFHILALVTYHFTSSRGPSLLSLVDGQRRGQWQEL